jgi:hypothetical protein
VVPLKQVPRGLLGSRVDVVGEVEGDNRGGCNWTHGPVGREHRRRPEREVRLLALAQLVFVDEGVEAISREIRVELVGRDQIEADVARRFA